MNDRPFEIEFRTKILNIYHYSNKKKEKFQCWKQHFTKDKGAIVKYQVHP